MSDKLVDKYGLFCDHTMGILGEGQHFMSNIYFLRREGGRLGGGVGPGAALRPRHGRDGDQSAVLPQASRLVDIQDDQINIAVCFWYLVRSDLSSVHFYRSIY